MRAFMIAVISVMVGLLAFATLKDIRMNSKDEVKQVREYNKVGTVVSIEGQDIFFEDEYGNVWTCESLERVNVGDIILAEMDTMGTKEIYDDMVLRINGGK